MRFVASLIAAFLLIAPAHAQQQQWAAAYVDWPFAQATPSGAGLEQDVWAPQIARASFFTINWTFAGGDGAYLGLQSNAAGAGNARFSVWNATETRNGNCRPFDGEGVGRTCELPLAIAPDRFYRLRLVRTAPGWWAGRVQWREANGTLRERTIGEIRAASGDPLIDPAGIHNFSEYWGNAAAQCGGVSLSAAIFAPPTLVDARGRRTLASAGNGTRPEGNLCRRGSESQGAIATHTTLRVGAQTAIALTLGGTPEANAALAARLRTQRPPARP
ncbi:MAG: hypothetical protein AB7J28_02640 [Hyphomonadaceae bacterium]